MKETSGASDEVQFAIVHRSGRQRGRTASRRREEEVDDEDEDEDEDEEEEEGAEWQRRQPFINRIERRNRRTKVTREIERHEKKTKEASTA